MNYADLKVLSWEQLMDLLIRTATTYRNAISQDWTDRKVSIAPPPTLCLLGDFEIRARFPYPHLEQGSLADISCTLSGPGRGDCEHFIGLPGKSIPGQHDGPDDTVDAYGKPNGWCWSCWNSYRYHELIYSVARAFPGESRHQTALRYIREAEERALNGPVGQLEPQPPTAA